MKLLVATRSPGKAREIRDLLAGLPFELLFPGDVHLERLLEEEDLERGTSYAENAVAKARYFAQRSGLPAVADDSGLEVDALQGRPGVHSARWAGGGAAGGGVDQDRRNNEKLLAALADVPEEQRSGRYRCVVAYLETPTAAPELVEASCEGYILAAPRGTGGFGYDPLFYSTDLKMSFGEAPPGAKHRASHRGRAFRALTEVLLRRLG
jgi:XTP/dITP diphosphohydrolase